MEEAFACARENLRAAAVSGAATRPGVGGATREGSAMRTVKIGVIGSGGISHAHMGGYQQLEGVEIVAVADVVPGKAKEWAARYKVSNAFEDYHKLLAMPEIDGVSVCTYNRAHMPPTVDALRAGKHVLCEKPMAHNLADAHAMLQAARET